MKILTLTTLFPNQMQPNYAVFIRNRIVALSKYAEVKVVAPVPWIPPFAFGKKADTYKAIPDYETIEGLEVYHPRYFVTPRIGRRFYGYLYYWSLRNFIANLHKLFKFDVLDVHWAYPDGYAGVLLAQQCNVPVCISLRGSDIHTYSYIPSRRTLVTTALNAADRIIAVSSSMVPIVAELGVPVHKVTVISNGVNRSVFKRVNRIEARHALGIDNSKKIILAVGRFDIPKRFDLIIQACAAIKKSTDIDFQLILVGNGSQLETLKSLVLEKEIPHQVFFAGEKDNRSLAAWYSAADIFCLASDKEGCPNVILESLSCGTPVVSSDVGNASEIIDAQTGCIVLANNVEKWTEAIVNALFYPWDNEHVARSQEFNDWDHVGRSVFDTLDEIVRSTTYEHS